MEELDGNDHDNLVYEFEKLAEKFELFAKEIGFQYYSEDLWQF